jgi:hypothetical protein
MYTPPPKVDKSLGLRPEDFPPSVVWVWPDNWAAVKVFDAMATQWRWGPSGPTGLDYSALPFVMATCGNGQAGLFDDVRVMELAAMEVIGK